MSERPPPSDAFRRLFASRADADASMPFDRFMSLALYDPEIGYYRRPHQRIGYAAGTDFFTASTSGPVFGELVTSACTALLGGPAISRDYTFVEIGAETPAGILANVAHPFAAVRTLRVGEPLALSGACIVFSNELFDAQPFRRFIFRDNAWRELGVALRENTLAEIELPLTAPPAELPASAPDGYILDAPLAAAALAREIAAQPWQGLFVAFDYGKTWPELIENTPAGTARVYHRHRQSNDLLAQPGEQDLTCHICWDWIESALRENDFQNLALESQESFFIRHAIDFIARISTDEAPRFSPQKLSLLQLLHPTHLGQKFQVLHAHRKLP